MKVLVTGSNGKVGRDVVTALLAAGHEVTGSDIGRHTFDRMLPGEPDYQQCDVTDAGQVFAVVRGMDAVVHAAAIPEPTHNPAHVVFSNNLVGLFNVLEASVRWGVGRFVNISSETVPGFFFPERAWLPEYAPVDEEHPIRPQDPYALAKHFGEQMCDAAVRRSDIRVVSIRPSHVQHPGNYERNLGAQVRDAANLSPNLWSYVDSQDLADAIALAVGSDLPGHEVFYIANPDNVGGRDFAAILHEHYGDQIELRHLERPDSSGISTAKAQRMLGWTAKRSWRDHLDEQGRSKDSPA